MGDANLVAFIDALIAAGVHYFVHPDRQRDLRLRVPVQITSQGRMMPKVIYDVRINGIDVLRIATWVARDDWADGPWNEEPDLVEWIDPTTGYPCLIIREDSLGQLNGYVALPLRHPLYGVGYDDLDEGVDEEHALSVHGGVTYAGSRLDHVNAVMYPDLALPEVAIDYWVGFRRGSLQRPDAGHGGGPEAGRGGAGPAPPEPGLAGATARQNLPRRRLHDGPVRPPRPSAQRAGGARCRR